MEKFYKKITGFDKAYSYQLKVADLVLGGKNVILSVPTGAGKTWASIFPFLYAKEHSEIPFPQKMIYSSPLRTLTNSIFDDVSEKVKGISIQTGEYSDDIYFENDIIFSTIDQTLANFLCFSLPLSKAQANINAGALIGSYLVFDEFHLLDPKRSMATTIGMLKILGNLTRCCIMTATLEGKFINQLKEQLTNFEIVTLDDFPADKQKIASLLPTENKKKIVVEDTTISAWLIEKYHKSKTIVICNRVESAQRIYRDLLELKNKSVNLSNIADENIICLHSRFFDEDRKAKEKKLKELFGKGNDKTIPAILIATQVIEAGMDLSCDVMHTEISPINSFLQRAGRCARFAHEVGEIYIYNVLDNEDKIALDNAITEEDKKEINRINNLYLPYNEKECNQSLNELKKHKTLDSEIPKQMIEVIAQNSDENLIEQMRLSSGGGFNQGKIIESWNTCEKNNYRDTIRDIQSVEVFLINDDLIEEVNKLPYRFQSLSLYKWSLVGWLNKVSVADKFLENQDDDWLAMKLEPARDMFLENDESIKYELAEIPKDKFTSIPNQVYLNSKYFGYSPAFGLNRQYEDTFEVVSPHREQKDENKEFKPLTKDTFYQHNKGLLSAFERDFLPKLDFTFNELSRYLKMPDLTRERIIELIKLMIVLHDYGKLNNDWQEPMQKYQAAKEKLEIRDFNEVLAHTDYDKNNQNDVNLGIKAGLHKRPGHAGVGAYVAQDIIEELYDNQLLKSCVSTAIARHHSSLSDSFPDFKISNKSFREMRRLLDEIEVDTEITQDELSGKLDGFETD